MWQYTLHYIIIIILSGQPQRSTIAPFKKSSRGTGERWCLEPQLAQRKLIHWNWDLPFSEKKQVVFHVKNCVNKKKWWNRTLKISKSPVANRTKEIYLGPSRVRYGEIRQFWAQKLERVAMDEHVWAKIGMEWIHRLSASWRVSLCWFLWVAAAAVNENCAVWLIYILYYII